MIPKAFATRQIGDDDDHDNCGDDDHNDDDDLVTDCLHWHHLVVPGGAIVFANPPFQACKPPP